MLKKYFVYLPEVPGSIEEEWEQCRNQIINTCKNNLRLLKLNIFINVKDYPAFVKIKKETGKSVIDTFGDQCPAFNITIHPPEHPWNVSVEALFISDCVLDIRTKFLNSFPYVVISSPDYKEVWGAGLGNDDLWDDTRKAGIAAFESVAEILHQEDMSFNNIVRQWNYIGNILKVKDGFQNYQVFNEVRSEYYNKYRTIPGYPAATGVGMKLGGVFLDFCAVRADGSEITRSVDNPNQVKAYEYGQIVLKGRPDQEGTIKHPPQFERALLVINKYNQTLFISGTASIKGQETIGKGDLNEQTLVTIENINKLTDIERINKLLGSSYTTGGEFSILRVYVKNQEDMETVKSICSEYFPKAPAIFVEVDLCRDDLLTEIEGVFVL